MAKSPIDSRSAGLRNERLVLALLREHSQLSQAQLCKLARFSSSTLSYIVGRLREKELIIETAGASRRRGAKPVLMSINPRGRFVIGVEVNPSGVRLGLADFTGALVGKLEVPLSPDNGPEAVCQAVKNHLAGLLDGGSADISRLLGVGVSLSGSISAAGEVVLASPLGWKNVPLGRMLEERLGVPVSVFPTRVRLLAERSISAESFSGNVIYINVGNGVGSDIILDKNLLHGATSRAGELGHIVLEPDGPVCGCGHRGCLEALISGPTLAAKFRTDIAAGTETVLREMIKPGDKPEKVIAAWGQALAGQDKYALECRKYLADHLCRAATIAINLFDPDMVMLAGYVVGPCYNYLANALEQRINNEVYDNLSRKIRISASRAGSDTLICGAAAAVLQNCREIA